MISNNPQYTTPIISVIVPIYNAERLLQKCIDSILTQSFENFELILVNDGSNDFSATICNKNYNNDNRIVVLHKQNGGVSSARNLGLQHAKGKYIVFIDADDWVEKEFLEKLYSATKNTADLSICEIQYHKRNKKNISNNSIIKEGKIKYLKYQITQGFTSVCNIMFKKELISNNNIKFEPIRYSEDFIFSIKAICLAKKIEYVETPLYNYNRENESSAMHNYPDDMYKDLMFCDSSIITFLKEQSLFNKIKREMYWRVLRNKKEMIFHPQKYDEFRKLIPESHDYILSCPMINFKEKILITLLNYHLDYMVIIIIKFRTLISKKLFHKNNRNESR